MAVVEQAAVAVYAGVRAFGKDFGDALPLQPGREFGARRSLHAMHRPERLRETVQVNLLEHFLARMIRGKTAVIGRMPVLRGDHQRERRLQPVRDRNDFIAVRHRERAPGQEIVLNIHQDECFHKLKPFAVIPTARP